METSSSRAVRCTISIVRRELGRIVMRAHVVNDTGEVVRCAPGTRRDGHALLATDLDLFCEPHAELGFAFAISRLGRSGKKAFVRVSGTTFACGFELALEDDAHRAAVISAAIALLLVAVLACVVFVEGRRRRRAAPPSRRREAPAEVLSGELVEEMPPARNAPQALRETAVRGFAAVLDEQRVVVGTLEPVRRRFLSSEFVARVVNETSEPVFCTLRARTRGGVVPLEPGSLRVHPESAATVAVVAPLGFPWRLRTLHLNMESSALRASTQVDVPVPLGSRVAVAAACALLVALAFFGYRATHPPNAVRAVASRTAAAGTVPGPAQRASVNALAVDPGVAHSGAPIDVTYSASAQSGSVELVGAGGVALEREPYERAGVTAMRAPVVDVPSEYEVTLDVSRGGSTAHASVGLLVLPLR